MSVSRENYTAWTNYEAKCSAGAAFTDQAISPLVAANQRFEVAEIKVTVDSAVSVVGGVSVRVGFAAATLPATSGVAATPATGIILSHAGIAAGSGLFGLGGVGTPGQELRATVEDPTGGSVTITFRGRTYQDS